MTLNDVCEACGRSRGVGSVGTVMRDGRGAGWDGEARAGVWRRDIEGVQGFRGVTGRECAVYHARTGRRAGGVRFWFFGGGGMGWGRTYVSVFGGVVACAGDGEVGGLEEAFCCYVHDLCEGDGGVNKRNEGRKDSVFVRLLR